MGHLDSLLKLILSPIGIGAGIAGLGILWYCLKNQKVVYLLMGGCLFCASLARYADEFITAPPLFGPLEILRSMGRPLTIGLLILIFLLALTISKQKRKIKTPWPLFGLIIVQYLIMVKTIFYGSIAFPIFYFLLFLLIIFTLCRGLGSRIESWENFNQVAGSIALAGGIFVWINSFQGVIARDAIVFVQGRFSGTTGNPNHAAVYLATVFPALLYAVIKSKKGYTFFWIATALLAFYWLLISGSRTGLFMAVMSFILFFSHKVLYFLVRIIGWGLALSLFFYVFPGLVEFGDVTEVIGWDGMAERLNRKSKGGLDTRADVWQTQFNYFNHYPIFGAPVSGDRIIFGENSWLGVAAQFGWTGLVPMLFFGVGMLYNMIMLWKTRIYNKAKANEISLCFAGLASLMIGSFNEAYLLGNLSFPIMSMILYLILADASLVLLAEEKKQKKELVKPVEFIYSPPVYN